MYLINSSAGVRQEHCEYESPNIPPSIVSCNLTSEQTDELNGKLSNWYIRANDSGGNLYLNPMSDDEWCNVDTIGWKWWTSIPPEIWNLVNLKGLKLTTNYLTSLPPEIWNLVNLTGLWLGNNSLTSLPLEICNLKNITWLVLGDNNSLWSLATTFSSSSATKSQAGIPTTWKTMTIKEDGSKIVITVTP